MANRAARQRKLKRYLDVAWHGFILAASTVPESIHKPLRHRCHLLQLEPPAMDKVCEWITRICSRAEIAIHDDEGVRVLAMHGGMNCRSVLTSLQLLRDAGSSLDQEAAKSAAREAGY